MRAYSTSSNYLVRKNIVLIRNGRLTITSPMLPVPAKCRSTLHFSVKASRILLANYSLDITSALSEQQVAFSKIWRQKDSLDLRITPPANAYLHKSSLLLPLFSKIIFGPSHTNRPCSYSCQSCNTFGPRPARSTYANRIPGARTSWSKPHMIVSLQMRLLLHETCTRVLFRGLSQMMMSPNRRSLPLVWPRRRYLK